jgi:hypothetical protein
MSLVYLYLNLTEFEIIRINFMYKYFSTYIYKIFTIDKKMRIFIERYLYFQIKFDVCHQKYFS